MPDERLCFYARVSGRRGGGSDRAYLSLALPNLDSHMVPDKTRGPTQRLRIIDAMDRYRFPVITADEFDFVAWQGLSPFLSGWDRGSMSRLPSANVLARFVAGDIWTLRALRPDHNGTIDVPHAEHGAR